MAEGRDRGAVQPNAKIRQQSDDVGCHVTNGLTSIRDTGQSKVAEEKEHS